VKATLSYSPQGDYPKKETSHSDKGFLYREISPSCETCEKRGATVFISLIKKKKGEGKENRRGAVGFLRGGVFKRVGKASQHKDQKGKGSHQPGRVY